MKLLLAASLFAALTATVLYLPAGADNEDGEVDVTITPKVISINVDTTSVSYNDVELNVGDVRPSPEGFSVSNNGTVDVDLYIRGDDTFNSDSSLGWTLGAAPGIETYAHRFSTDNAPTIGDFTPLTTSLQSLFSSSVSPGSGIDVKLSLGTPTETNNLGAQTTTVSVLATDVGVVPTP